MYYLTETDPRGAMGLGGKDEVGVGAMGSYITRHRLQDRQDGLEAQVPHGGGDGRGAPGC